MLPVLLATVRMPSATFHFAGWERSWAETHSSRFFPAKRMMASEGGLPHSGAGVTTLGSGCQTSVSSGLAVDCWEWIGSVVKGRRAKRNNIQNWVRMVSKRIQRNGADSHGPQPQRKIKIPPGPGKKPRTRVGHPGADSRDGCPYVHGTGTIIPHLEGSMITRRSFMIASGMTALASTRVFGANDKLRIGVVGAGHRMKGLLDAADKAGAYEIVAVSDVYGPNRDAVKERSNGLATTHLDYREVLDKNVDAVIIASPDHWHVPMAVDALKASKDVFLEKPVTHTIEEGEILTRAVRSGKQILQCGMQQRSWTHFRDAVDLIQAGSLGRVVQVRTYWWQNYQRNWGFKPVDPQELDWKLWLGSAPEQAFSDEKLAHWRWYWNFGGGAMTDLFTHWIDVVHWAMKADTSRQACMLG